MKIGLVSERSVNGHSKGNLETIIDIIEKAKSFDLLLFSEAFLHGFDGLTWIYETDINIAIYQESEFINLIKLTCKRQGVAVGFGYFEKDEKDIYCSYLIISKNGEIVHNYRRLSIGWKEYSKTNNNYKEGCELTTFRLEGKTFVVILWGDLWDDSIKSNLSLVLKNSYCDFVIWPNHLDYSVDQFNTELLDYQNRTIDINLPILLINDYWETSCGGAVVFQNGEILCKLPTGTIGILEFLI